MYLSAQFLQVGAAFGAVRECNPRVAKLVNPPLICPHEGVGYVGRFEQIGGKQIDESPLIDAGAAGAESWWLRYGPLVDQRAYLGAVECLNEPGTHRSDRPALVAEYCLRWLERLDFRYGGKIKGIVCNFSEGTPEPKTAKFYVELAQYVSDNGHAFGFHSYWYPRYGRAEQARWHYRRWAYFYQELHKYTSVTPRILITELGVDGGVVKKPERGWRDASLPWTIYLGDLLSFRYDAEALAPHIEAGFVFCADTNSGRWDGFNLGYSEVKGLLISNGDEPAGPSEKELLLNVKDSLGATRSHLNEALAATASAIKSLDQIKSLDE